VLDEDLGRRRRGPRRGDLTVATIAQLAGVSAPTVSKVINGRAGVGPETRQRVEELLRSHGYRKTAPGIATESIEVVFFSVLSPLAIDILRGVQQVAGTRDLAVGFVDVQRATLAGNSWAQPLLARQPTGLITVFMQPGSEHRDLLEHSDIPMVAVDPTGDLPPTATVGSANWSGGLAATRHLIELGHRRIGAITGPTRDLSSRARLDGLRTALETADIPFDQNLVRSGQFRVDHGRELGLELLNLPEPPTAVVCGDDLQAFGLYEAARITGHRIPEDLSVIGFDDIDYCQWCAPALTTVRQPFTEMGATAARLVLAMADGECPAQTQFELATSLMVRGSTAPVAAN
jgi:DNA-binding LacI/PurR family transcriptional regulator